MRAKAAVLYEAHQPMTVEEVEVQDPRAGEVLVRIAASGVCFSDVHPITGHYQIPLPVVLGHEGAGVVESVGPGVEAVRPGDHVVLSWAPYCGSCFYCHIGRFNQCEVTAPKVLDGTMLDGTRRLRNRRGQELFHYSYLSTFAEYAVVPESSCIKIRPDMPLDKASLIGCAVTTGVGAAFNTARVTPGSTVAVFGCGGVGLNVIQGAALCGAARIIGIDMRESKLELARRFGATDTVNAAGTDTVEAVRALTGGRGADFTFEAIGRPDTMAATFAAARRAGTAVMVGIPGVGAELKLPAVPLPREEKILTGSFYGSCRPHADMPMLVDLYLGGRLKLDELIGGVYPLDQVNAAVAELRAGDIARPVIAFDR